MNSKSCYIFFSADNLIIRMWEKPRSSLLDGLNIPIFHEPLISNLPDFKLSWNLDINNNNNN